MRDDKTRRKSSKGKRRYSGFLAKALSFLVFCGAVQTLYGAAPVEGDVAGKPTGVQVQVQEVTGEEYEKCCAAAEELFEGGGDWADARLLDYALTDAGTGAPVELDRPVKVDIALKQPGLTPRVVTFTGAAPAELPVTRGQDGGYSFSIGSSARLLIVAEPQEEENSRQILKIRTVAADNETEPLSGAQLRLVGGGDKQEVTTMESGEAIMGPIDQETFYTLTEPEAPAGYMAMAGSVYFKVGPEGQVTFYNENGGPSETSDPYRLLHCEPQREGSGEILLVMKTLPVYRLPKTGGSGALYYLWGGMALLLAGVGGWCARRRYIQKAPGGAG